MRIFAEHFIASSQNIGDIKREKDSKDWSRSLEWFYISDKYEKPAQENIQGVATHLEKLKTQWAEANRARGWIKTLREENPPCQQPQEGLR